MCIIVYFEASTFINDIILCPKEFTSKQKCIHLTKMFLFLTYKEERLLYSSSRTFLEF